MIATGFRKSEIDGSEHIFGIPSEGMKIPEKYSYKKYLPAVLDQGNKPICVPCSVSTYLNWRENLKTGRKSNNGIDYDEIFSAKKIEGEGMTFKEALGYLRHHGVNSKAGNLKIDEYAMVRSEFQLKAAIFMNGPCVGALPVYNFNYDFWNKYVSDEFQGCHAIAIVGYDKEGFIIRNSWGKSFGKSGYTTIPYDEINNFIEIWTIID